MNKTPIEWVRNDDGSLGYTVNPLRARPVGTTGRSGHYCEKTSPGCKHCYSSKLQPRFGMPAFGAGQLLGTVDLFLDEGKLDAVLRHRKPTRIFWCDMTDLFGEWVPDEWIDRCVATMALAPEHTHILVTKRARRMHDYFTAAYGRVFDLVQNAGRTWLRDRDTEEQRAAVSMADARGEWWPLANVWMLVSAEDQQRANERILWLLQTPAVVRGLSMEPLLADVNLRRLSFGMQQTRGYGPRYIEHDCLTGWERQYARAPGPDDLPTWQVSDVMQLKLNILLLQEAGWWVAQCLEYDVAGQGKTTDDALYEVQRLLFGRIAAAIENGVQEPLQTLPPAPPPYWEKYERSKRLEATSPRFKLPTHVPPAYQIAESAVRLCA